MKFTRTALLKTILLPEKNRNKKFSNESNINNNNTIDNNEIYHKQLENIIISTITHNIFYNRIFSCLSLIALLANLLTRFSPKDNILNKNKSSFNNNNNDKDILYPNYSNSILGLSLFANLILCSLHECFHRLNKFNIIESHYFVKNYWHTYKASLRFALQLTFISNYLLCLICAISYNDYRDIIWKYTNYFSITLLEIYLINCTVFLIYYFFKALVNIFLILMFITAIFVGYYEDCFNLNINRIIKTQVKKANFKKENSLIFDSNNKDKIVNEDIAKELKDDVNSKEANDTLSKRSSLQETCAICLNDIAIDDVISILPCFNRHCYHTYCLEIWFSSNTSCPICRTNFNYLFDQSIINNNIDNTNNRINSNRAINLSNFINNNNNNNNAIEMQNLRSNLL